MKYEKKYLFKRNIIFLINYQFLLNMNKKYNKIRYSIILYFQNHIKMN